MRAEKKERGGDGGRPFNWKCQKIVCAIHGRKWEGRNESCFSLINGINLVREEIRVLRNGWGVGNEKKGGGGEE